MDICNIKFHCIISDKVQFSESFRGKGYKTYPSFEVFKIGNYSFMCYYNGFLNVTGVKTFDEIDISLNKLKEYLNNFHLNFKEIIVDNITTKCTCLNMKHICLQTKKEKLKKSTLSNQITSIKYEREIFPSMFIKTNLGTIIWSTNNKVSCVGLKSLKNIRDICSLVQSIEKI